MRKDLNVWEAFSTDPDATSQGVWLRIETPDGHVIGELRCLPAEANLNKKYAAAIIELAAIEAREKPSDDQKINNIAGVWATTIVTDWRGDGWTDPDGTPQSFTSERCRAMFIAMPLLFKAVQIQTQDWTNYRREYAEGVAGN